MAYPNSMYQGNPNRWSLNHSPNQFANEQANLNPNFTPADFGVMNANASASPAISPGGMFDQRLTQAPTGYDYTQTLSNAPATGVDTNSSMFGDLFSRESMYGGKSGGGWLSGLSGVASNLIGGYTGLKQLQLGQDQLKEAKALNRVNLANQAKTTNSTIGSRYQNQYGRASAEERANMLSPEDFNNANFVKGTV